MARALGGLGANIRAGLMALVALLIWTLPFTALWLGAWWAGWDNAFNKGYGQAFIGPSVFFIGVFAAALILPAVPLVFAHLAAEDRLSAAFEVRRLRSVVVQAGWRVPALAVLTAALAVPFAAARGLITTAPDWAPQQETMTSDQRAEVQGWITLALAALAFPTVWLTRSLAARIYTRAAGLKPGLWDGAQAAEGAVPAPRRSRVLTAVWYALAMAAALALSFLILAGQFLDYPWRRWIFHAGLTLPWAG